jgi:hypothetical protein
MRRPTLRLGGAHNSVALVRCRAEPGSPSRSVPFDDPGPCESNRSRVRPEERVALAYRTCFRARQLYAR